MRELSFFRFSSRNDVFALSSRASFDVSLMPPPPPPLLLLLRGLVSLSRVSRLVKPLSLSMPYSSIIRGLDIDLDLGRLSLLRGPGLSQGARSPAVRAFLSLFD